MTEVKETLTPQQQIQREQELRTSLVRQRTNAINAGNKQLQAKLTQSINGCDTRITAIQLQNEG